MPVSVCKLVFQDPDCKKLAHSKLEIRHIYHWYGQIGWFLDVLPGTSRLQMSTRRNILCGQLAVSCYHVGQLLPLGWYSLEIDWTIIHLEPVLSLAVLTIQRSTKSVFMFQGNRLKCLTAKVWVPSSLQARNKFLPIILMFLMVLDAFLVPHTIFRWILV